MKYSILSQTHPKTHGDGYTPERWCELQHLYEGGYEIQEHAAKYLPKMMDESEVRWRERLDATAYIGYLGEIVEYLVAALFSRSLSITAEDPRASAPAYLEFAGDADLGGNNLADFLRRTMTTAMVKGKAIIGCDFPAAPSGVTSRYDEERIGASRPYVYDVQPEQLIDWECANIARRIVQIGNREQVEWDAYTLRFAVLRRCYTVRKSPEDLRGPMIEEFKVWQLRDGRAAWQLYEIERKKDAKIEPNADVPLVAEGVTTFREIPLQIVKLPANLWVGNLIGLINKEHWRRRSALVASQNQALHEILVAYLGPEITGIGEALPAERAQRPDRADNPVASLQKKGVLTLGKDDRLKFESPSGTAWQVVDGQLDKLVEQIHRVSHRMAASMRDTTQPQSGLSKQMDLDSTIVVLKAYGAIARACGLELYEMISEARNESGIRWVAHGLDNYEAHDRTQVIDEALSLNALQIGSRTFQVENKVRSAFALLPDLPPNQKDRIRKEIEDSIPEEQGLDAGEGQDAADSRQAPNGAGQRQTMMGVA